MFSTDELWSGASASFRSQSDACFDVFHDCCRHLFHDSTAHSHFQWYHSKSLDSAKCHRSWRWSCLQLVVFPAINVTNHPRKHGRPSPPHEWLHQGSDLALQDENQ